jgi:hypothetical protein
MGRLCHGIGGMTLRELRKRMTASEITYWQAFELEFGPIGPARDDVLAGWLAMFSIAPHRGEDAPPLDLTNYIPRWRPEPPDDEEDEEE